MFSPTVNRVGNGNDDISSEENFILWNSPFKKLNPGLTDILSTDLQTELIVVHLLAFR